MPPVRSSLLSSVVAVACSALIPDSLTSAIDRGGTDWVGEAEWAVEPLLLKIGSTCLALRQSSHPSRHNIAVSATRPSLIHWPRVGPSAGPYCPPLGGRTYQVAALPPRICSSDCGADVRGCECGTACREVRWGEFGCGWDGDVGADRVAVPPIELVIGELATCETAIDSPLEVITESDEPLESLCSTGVDVSVS